VVLTQLTHHDSLFVAGAVVRWAPGREYGLETLVMEKETQTGLGSMSNTWYTKRRTPVIVCRASQFKARPRWKNSVFV
jgi:hypothetical protein